ncbi:CTP--2,3-di-O-geranylgeranyl-sn-glycero-1-phosphate cytidyltransferase [Candidatus Pacearchaeota archaeon]|nr:CTP--2,3-di-O-geranylgeranyl-sn-glycero-1-phosphate cytidyltransferase [Candidatus Pacearchaeota archaeon]
MGKSFGFELRRKLIHLTSLIPIILYVLIAKYISRSLALLSLTFVLIIFLSIEFIRIKHKKKIPFIHVFYRNKEKNKIASHVYFMLGIIIAFSIFDFRIAFVALLMTIFGDLTAALVGMKFGKHKIKRVPHKKWEGVIAELAVNLFIGFIFLQNWMLVLVMALTATFVETFFIHADDNMIIPVFAGFNGQIALIILKVLRIM